MEDLKNASESPLPQCSDSQSSKDAGGDDGPAARGCKVLPESSMKRKRDEPAHWFELDNEHNPYVYVTNLPRDMKETEFIDLMKKYGVIKMKDVQRGLYNIKMYKDHDGRFKGDAMCCYVRLESVQLALLHLDGLNYDGTHIIHAERARFQLKGEYDPSKRPRKATKKDKLKEQKRLEKLLSWKPDKLPNEKPKNFLTVVLSNMFDVHKLKEDPTLILEIREDVESLCNEECGPVHKVIVYDKNVNGVVTIKFKDFESSEKCVRALNNRWFDRRLVKAEFWDGQTRYKVEETPEEEEARVAKWEEDLDKEDTEKVRPLKKNDQQQRGEVSPMPTSPNDTSKTIEESDHSNYDQSSGDSYPEDPLGGLDNIDDDM